MKKTKTVRNADLLKVSGKKNNGEEFYFVWNIKTGRLEVPPEKNDPELSAFISWIYEDRVKKSRS